MLNYGAISQELGAADLVNLYNKYSGKPTIKKFSDKETAQKRVEKVLYTAEAKAEDMKAILSPRGKEIVEAHDIVEDVTVVRAAKPATEEKPTKPKKEPSEKSSTGNRNTGKKLYKVNAERLRKGSRREINFNKIEDGMLYEDYKKKGGNVSDLSIMIRDGVVKAE